MTNADLGKQPLWIYMITPYQETKNAFAPRFPAPLQKSVTVINISFRKSLVYA